MPPALHTSPAVPSPARTSFNSVLPINPPAGLFAHEPRTSMFWIPLPPLPMSQPQCELFITQRTTDILDGSSAASIMPLGSTPAALAAWYASSNSSCSPYTHHNQKHKRKIRSGEHFGTCVLQASVHASLDELLQNAQERTELFLQITVGSLECQVIPHGRTQARQGFNELPVLASQT